MTADGYEWEVQISGPDWSGTSKSNNSLGEALGEALNMIRDNVSRLPNEMASALVRLDETLWSDRDYPLYLAALALNQAWREWDMAREKAGEVS